MRKLSFKNIWLQLEELGLEFRSPGLQANDLSTSPTFFPDKSPVQWIYLYLLVHFLHEGLIALISASTTTTSPHWLEQDKHICLIHLKA